MHASHERKRQIRAADKARAKAAAKVAAKAAAKTAVQAAKVAAAAAADDDDDPPARDIEEIRADLARRISVLIGAKRRYWRGCPQRVCRRARACRTPRGACSGAPPAPPMTAEQRELANAKVRQMLAAVIRKLDDRDRTDQQS